MAGIDLGEELLLPPDVSRLQVVLITPPAAADTVLDAFMLENTAQTAEGVASGARPSTRRSGRTRHGR